MRDPVTLGGTWQPAIPFTPSHVSVNRVRVLDLPGVTVDDEVRGQLAYHLLSALAITRYARERADSLALPDEYLKDSPVTRQGLPRWVDASLASTSASRRQAAEEIARRLGRNLGHVVLALHRGDAVNRAARDEWGDGEWTRWAAVRRVWLAGGLVSGELGRRIVEHAHGWLTAAGYAGQPAIERSPLRQDMVLHGAARYLRPGSSCGLCLDFGHTAVKRACFRSDDRTVTPLLPLTPIAVEGNWHVNPDADLKRTGTAVRAMIVDAIVDAWRQAVTAGHEPAADVVLSLAAYVQGGRVLGNGLYATMHALAKDVRPMLAQGVSDLVDRPVRIHLIHDGTAAGAMHAGEEDTAVIIAGTALGVGFPPATATALLSLAQATVSQEG